MHCKTYLPESSFSKYLSTSVKFLCCLRCISSFIKGLFNQINDLLSLSENDCWSLFMNICWTCVRCFSFIILLLLFFEFSIQLVLKILGFTLLKLKLLIWTCGTLCHFKNRFLDFNRILNRFEMNIRLFRQIKFFRTIIWIELSLSLYKICFLLFKLLDDSVWNDLLFLNISPCTPINEMFM